MVLLSFLIYLAIMRGRRILTQNLKRLESICFDKRMVSRNIMVELRTIVVPFCAVPVAATPLKSIIEAINLADIDISCMASEEDEEPL